MAETFLEAIGVLQSFGLQYLFVPMLIFVIAFGVLMRTKALSEKMDLNAVVAFIIAILVALNPVVSQFFYSFLPLTTAALIIFFGAILLFLFMGASADDIGNFFKSTPSWIFFVVLFLIFVMASYTWTFPDVQYATLAAAGGQTVNTTEGQLTPFEALVGPNSFMIVLGSPRVLGLVSFMLLAGIIGAVVAYQSK